MGNNPKSMKQWIVLEWFGINLRCCSLKQELICNAACGLFWTLVVTCTCFFSCSELAAAFPTIPGGTDSSRWDVGPSGNLRRWGSAFSCSCWSSVLCLKWRALQFKDGKFFSVILQILMIEMIWLWLKISGRPDGTSEGIWGDSRYRHADQNQKWHSGRWSANDVPCSHGAEGRCVCPYKKAWELSRTSSTSSPVLQELSVSSAYWK